MNASNHRVAVVSRDARRTLTTSSAAAAARSSQVGEQKLTPRDQVIELLVAARNGRGVGSDLLAQPLPFAFEQSCAPGRAGQRTDRRVRSSRVARQPETAELPACVGREEIAVGRADVRARGRAGAAAQHVLVAHEFAVVLADRAGRRRDNRGRARRRSASIPRRRRRAARAPASVRAAGRGCSAPLSTKLPSTGTRRRRLPTRLRSAAARRPSARRRRPRRGSRGTPVRRRSSGTHAVQRERLPAVRRLPNRAAPRPGCVAASPSRRTATARGGDSRRRR